MAKASNVPESALHAVEAFCADRVPPHARDAVKVDYTLRGTSITLVEARPLWNGRPGAEWTSMKVAQLRFDASSQTWTLFARDRNERWMAYDFVEPSRDIEALLIEVDRDPTGIFWG